MKLNIAHVEPHSEIYAPNAHFVIWVQGCSIRCEGCWNERMWTFDTQSRQDITDLLAQIAQAQQMHAIQGVAFLGGEPLDQAPAIAELCQTIKQMGLGITLYTGYEGAELDLPARRQVLAYVDLLIAGRYVQARRNTDLIWRGSDNQTVQFLTDFYEKASQKEANYCEIKIQENGKITILGFPSPELLDIL